MLLPSAPDSLSKMQHPTPPFGRYKGLIIDTDVSSWQKLFYRRLVRKGWIYAGIYNQDFAMGFAVADTGYLGKAFIYLYHIPSKTFIEEAAEFPFYFGNSFMPSLSAPWFFKQGKKSWHVARVEDDLEFSYEGKKLKINFILSDYRKGLSVVAPAGSRPFNFTYKNAGLDIAAEIEFNGMHHSVKGNYGVLDFTLGFPPRHTHWNWASATGITDDGKVVGLNLVAHFNDSLENVLWLDGNMIPLSKAEFNYASPPAQSEWHVHTTDGIIDMKFQPEGARKDHINVGILKHQFVQPFGSFKGIIKHEGKAIPFTAFGVTEEHESIW